MKQFLYSVDGSIAQPTPLTMGPWVSSAQHGGPPAALLTFLIEQHLEPDETLSRLHVDLLAGVPLSPLRIESSRYPKTKRVTHVESRLVDGERVVAQAKGLLLRGSVSPQADAQYERADLPDPHEVETVEPPAWWSPSGSTPFHSHGVTHRFVSGSFHLPGPAVDWIRLDASVVEGHDLTGAQRIACISDLGSGISALFGPESRFGMINTDLNIGFVGSPEGDWFCLDAETTVAENETGLAATRIFDEKSQLVAVVSQSLLGQHISKVS